MIDGRATTPDAVDARLVRCDMRAAGIDGVHELAVAHDPAAARSRLADLVRARFGSAAPMIASPTDAGLGGGSLPPEVRRAMQTAAAPLLGLVGLASMIPGFAAPELAALRMPVFLGVGDRDITEPVETIMPDLPEADVHPFTLTDSGHNHNLSENCVQMWDQMDRWIRQVVAA